MSEEKRIYVVVVKTIQVPIYPNNYREGMRTVVQPPGRQFAQGCHVTNTLRVMLTARLGARAFADTTTIVLQVRDSSEMKHVYDLLNKHRLQPVLFGDENPEYGPNKEATAVAALATKTQVKGILDYLPLWG